MDALSYAGAQELSARIVKYWKKRGYDVKAWIEAISLDVVSKNGKPREDRLYMVRTNLVNGKPV